MDFNGTLLKGNICNLFASRMYNQYINFYDLFLLYFQRIPNAILEENIDCEKANAYFYEKYKKEIKETIYKKGNFENERISKKQEICYVLDDIVIIFFPEIQKVNFLFPEKQSDKIQTIIAELISFKKRKKNLKLVYSLAMVD